MKEINVSSKSSTNDLSDLIIKSLNEQGLNENACVGLKAIGAGAVNQAIKGIAVARTHLKVVCKPEFFNVTLEGNEKSGLRLIVKEEI